MNHYNAKSKGNWGREDAKTAEELNKLCDDFFAALVVPVEWKCMGWRNVVDADGVLISVGKLYRDLRTSGIGMMEYRVYFNTFSTMGGVCSKAIIDFGKYKYNGECYNKNIIKMNEFIETTYKILQQV